LLSASAGEEIAASAFKYKEIRDLKRQLLNLMGTSSSRRLLHATTSAEKKERNEGLRLQKKVPLSQPE